MVEPVATPVKLSRLLRRQRKLKNFDPEFFALLSQLESSMKLVPAHCRLSLEQGIGLRDLLIKHEDNALDPCDSLCFLLVLDAAADRAL